MKMTCPKCSEPIRPDGIDLVGATTYCAECDQKFPLPDLPDPPARVKPPEHPRSVLNRSASNLTLIVPCAGFHGAARFITVFAIIWNTLFLLIPAIFFLQESNSSRGSNAPDVVLLFGVGVSIVFFIPLILIGVASLVAAVFQLFSDTALAMDRSTILVERRFLGYRSKKSHALSQIRDVLLTVNCRVNDHTVYAIGIQLNNQQMPEMFGSHLSNEEKQWLVGELYAFWKEQC